MQNETCAPQFPREPLPFSDAEIKQIARLCHEVNRAVCLVNGDDVAPPWESAPEWMVESCVDGVRKAVGRPFNSDSRANHDNWLEHKLRDGWRYGKTKDPAAKTHPCMLPFHALPKSQQIKDDLFLAVVSAWAARRPPMS